MKKYFASIALALLISTQLWAQDITGQWNGLLKVQSMQLRLVFNVSKSGDTYTSTMDSPDQGVKGIPVTSTTFANTKLRLSLATLNINYEGALQGDSIVGTFVQNGQSFPLNLTRKPVEKLSLVRPQEPVKPFAYHAEEVTFQNEKDKITLAGTLTMPAKEGNFPAVVLITGSGAQNRDQEMVGHKPFLVLSDYLTKKGIAVLRYDDRGVGSSTGNYQGATTADLARDVEAAVKYLEGRKEINKKQIGLIGHSEGGVIAPIVATQHKDIRFIVLLAGPGLPGAQILLMQQELIGRSAGLPDEALNEVKKINTGLFNVITKSASAQAAATEITSFLKQAIKTQPAINSQGVNEDAFIKAQVDQLVTPWMYYFLKYDPAPGLEKVTCPVLALNGSKDLQVPAKENLDAIQKALAKGGNKNVTVKELPNLNHLFQESETGSPQEYQTIEQTISPIVLNEMAQWINAVLK